MGTDRRPLEGLSVVVTRAKAQASVLTDRLVALGAIPVEIATIDVVPPLDGGAALRRALGDLASIDQIVVASPNGARALLAALGAVPVPEGVVLPPVACVGPSTAAQLAESPLLVNIVPERAVAEGLVQAMPVPSLDHNRLLLVQAEVARDVLETELAAKGWKVTRVIAYRTVDVPASDVDRGRALGADIVTFTSSSTVERFLTMVGHDAVPPVVASIGPITSATARQAGLHVDIEADPHSIQGLVDALAAWARSR